MMLFPTLRTPPLETLAYLAALSAEERTYQRDILQARKYYAGEQFIELTARLREFLGGDTLRGTQDFERLRLNVYRTVISAVIERMVITGFSCDDPDVAAWAWDTWQANRMDAKQRRVHEAAIRDGESFVFVDWDSTTGRARLTPHVRFIDGTLGGDGQGCKAFYENDDPDQPLLFVTKRWTETIIVGTTRRTRQRLTVYFPDRIEKYAGFPGAFQPVVDDDSEAWPLPWLDRRGRPLGIPIAVVASSYGPEGREAIGPQNAINKSIIDLMAAGDMTAFRVLVALGWEPVDAAGNPLPIEPGAWIGTTARDARVQAIEPADLSSLIGLVDKWIYWLAMVTDTPVSRFITTAAIAAEGTLKQQEGPLINKIRNRQGEVGNGWEDALSIARRLENTFGSGDLNEDAQLSARWAPAEVRDETAELDRAERKLKLGIPQAQIWRELGYSEDQITAWTGGSNA